MIYFLQRKDGAIKIGTTRKYKNRLASLKKTHGKLQLIGMMPGSYDEERSLHNRFRSLWLKGEWFGPNEELLDFIHHDCNYDWDTLNKEDAILYAENLARENEAHASILLELLKDVYSSHSMLEAELSIAQNKIDRLYGLTKEFLKYEVKALENELDRTRNEHAELQRERKRLEAETAQLEKQVNEIGSLVFRFNGALPNFTSRIKAIRESVSKPPAPPSTPPA